MIERQKEAKTQAEGEAGPMLGAQHGTQSRDSRIALWAKGRRQTAEPPRDPRYLMLLSATVNEIDSLISLSSVSLLVCRCH